MVRVISTSKARRALAAFFLGGVLSLVLPGFVCADPPSWAPAHGWRKKHDPDYIGYTGNQWQRDYGIVAGHCDYEAVGTVLGGVLGGAVGAKVGGKENRPIAILVGAVIGSVVGRQIGRSIEDADRACIAHSLELAKDYQKVTWKNPKSGAIYLLRPHAGYAKKGRTCRDFDLRVSLNGRTETSLGKACQTAGGTWKVAP